MYTLTFVTYAEIVRVQCYQGRNVEMGYISENFGNDKSFKMPFLRDTHLPVAHRICHVVSNIKKLVWLKLSKRLVSKRQMPMPILSWQRTWHIDVCRMVGGTCPH